MRAILTMLIFTLFAGSAAAQRLPIYIAVQDFPHFTQGDFLRGFRGYDGIAPTPESNVPVYLGVAVPAQYGEIIAVSEIDSVGEVNEFGMFIQSLDLAAFTDPIVIAIRRRPYLVYWTVYTVNQHVLGQIALRIEQEF